jgi:hypothetical protein
MTCYFCKLPIAPKTPKRQVKVGSKLEFTHIDCYNAEVKRYSRWLVRG